MAILASSLVEIPEYLQGVLDSASVGQNQSALSRHTSVVLSLSEIQNRESRNEQHLQLLLRRHAITEDIARSGFLFPPLILDRAYTYVALGYADLAVADAFVAYTLCLSTKVDRDHEWISDLKPRNIDSTAWPRSGLFVDVAPCLLAALRVLHSCLMALGASKDAEEKHSELESLEAEIAKKYSTVEDSQEFLEQALRLASCISGVKPVAQNKTHTSQSTFGASRREIYPWNEHEPDRNSRAAISEINSLLEKSSPNLEVKVTALPALNSDGVHASAIWYQLGLFAKQDLLPAATILQEKSMLTAIRPLDDALCDACGIDLESISRTQMRQCPGEDCDVTFCSEDCAVQAAKRYHKPNIDTTDLKDGAEDDEGNMADSDEDVEMKKNSATPFCGNSALDEVGRTSSTSTPEWDLYFLLLTRTIQMSTTQSEHPLRLPETKYLWGDLTRQSPSSSSSSSSAAPRATLPFSLYHNVALPLQYFETLMLASPDTATPYSRSWLDNFDWWILQTLTAKFRGVANAQQSTYDGKAEIAAVHPLWCLANHSCAPNVTWTPTGTREFRVRTADDLVWAHQASGRSAEETWAGIKKGDEIWSHYTDVRLGVAERRERLQEVLGGVCRCARCVHESGEKGLESCQAHSIS